MLCATCETKLRALRLLDQEIEDLVEAESKYGLDVVEERRELEALREAVEGQRNDRSVGVSGREPQAAIAV
jgi:hypothetical protein